MWFGGRELIRDAVGPSAALTSVGVQHRLLRQVPDLDAADKNQHSAPSAGPGAGQPGWGHSPEVPAAADGLGAARQDGHRHHDVIVLVFTELVDDEGLVLLQLPQLHGTWTEVRGAPTSAWGKPISERGPRGGSLSLTGVRGHQDAPGKGTHCWRGDPGGGSLSLTGVVSHQDALGGAPTLKRGPGRGSLSLIRVGGYQDAPGQQPMSERELRGNPVTHWSRGAPIVGKGTWGESLSFTGLRGHQDAPGGAPMSKSRPRGDPCHLLESGATRMSLWGDPPWREDPGTDLVTYWSRGAPTIREGPREGSLSLTGDRGHQDVPGGAPTSERGPGRGDPHHLPESEATRMPLSATQRRSATPASVWTPAVQNPSLGARRGSANTQREPVQERPFSPEAPSSRAPSAGEEPSGQAR